MTDRSPHSPRLAPSFLGLLVSGALSLSCGSQTDSTAPPDEIVTVTETADMDPEVVELINEHVERAEASFSDPEARGDLGLAYHANNMFPEAQVCYEQAAHMTEDPLKKHEWLYLVALMKRRNGDLPGALEVMQRVSKTFKKTSFVRIWLGDLLVEDNDLAGAEQAYTRAIELSPKDALGRVRLANVLQLTDRSEEAIEILEEVIKDSPQYKSAHFRLGQAYQAEGRAEEAKRELQLGADSAPGSPLDPFTERLATKGAGYGLKMGRVENLLGSGRTDEALEGLDAIHETRPDDIMVLNLYAKAHARKTEFPTALEWLDKSLAIDETNFVTHMLYAEYALHSNQLDLSLTHAERAVELAPGQGMAHYRLGWILLFGKEQLDEALEACRTAEDLGCQDPELYMTLAQAYGQKQMFRESMKYSRLAAERVPNHLGAHVTLARAALASNDILTFHTAFLAAKAVAPADPAVLELQNIANSLEESQGQ